MKIVYNLYGVIGEEVKATDFMAMLAGLKPEDEVEVHISSPGGSVTEALAIANRITAEAKTRKMSCIVDGQACSMASVILAAFPPENRNVAKQSMVMIHNPSGEANGDKAAMLQTAELLKGVESQIVALYASLFPDAKPEQIAAWMEAETFIFGDNIAPYGMKVNVVDGVKMAAVSKGGINLEKAPEQVKKFYGEVPPPVPPAPAVPPAPPVKPEDKPPEAPAKAEAVICPHCGKDIAAPVVPPVVEDKKPEQPPVPPTPAAANEIVALSERLQTIIGEAKKHQSAADKLRAELKAEKELRVSEVNAMKLDVTAKAEQVKVLEARLSAVSLAAFSLSPEVANWEDAMKAVGGDPKAPTHPQATLLALKEKFPVMYDQWRASLNRKR
jgi:ATP-dependent Clp protease protease subunit